MMILGRPDSEQYPTLVQGLYFSTVTCTTIGYGEVTPSGGPAQAFTIAYSLFGIVGMGVFMIEMGEIFITASEVPTSVFLRRVVLHWWPGVFPGISPKVWRAAGLVAMNLAYKNAEFCIKNAEFCIKNHEFNWKPSRIWAEKLKNDGFPSER